MFSKYRLRNYNFKLFAIVIILCVIGTMVINSADSSYFRKQIFGVVVCVIGMIVMSLIDYHKFCKIYILLYIVNLIILTLLFVFGYENNGATRWYKITSSMTIQPSEFTKIIMVIFLAALLTKIWEHLNTARNLILVAICCGVPLFLVFLEPDLSTTIDIFVIMFMMIFVAGLSYKIIGIAVLILIPIAGSFLWYVQTPGQKLLTENQLGRVLAFLYPQDYLATNYQQNNSVMAIGSGMLTGKGLNSGTVATVKDANFISEQQTDFIFSVVGEELGFIGCVAIVVIVLLLVLECISMARKAVDREGMLIATGIATWFGFQSFINMGVATGILPNTGIPLPFISYGLSSLVSSCGAIGLVLNIGLQRKKY